MAGFRKYRRRQRAKRRLLEQVQRQTQQILSGIDCQFIGPAGVDVAAFLDQLVAANPPPPPPPAPASVPKVTKRSKMVPAPVRIGGVSRSASGVYEGSVFKVNMMVVDPRDEAEPFDGPRVLFADYSNPSSLEYVQQWMLTSGHRNGVYILVTVNVEGHMWSEAERFAQDFDLPHHSFSLHNETLPIIQALLTTIVRLSRVADRSIMWL
eukprot:c19594_g1_i2.p2 GENE.c19594_g1_i2~~c19594_g1_i2.p2  ORF type:complete len:209 (-),score=33.26 c19594_g1_i2:189-815(-)